MNYIRKKPVITEHSKFSVHTLFWIFFFLFWSVKKSGKDIRSSCGKAFILLCFKTAALMLVGIADQNDLWKQMKFISVNLRNGNEVFETHSLLGFNDRYIKNGNIFDIFSSLSNCQANLFCSLQVSNRLLFKFVCFWRGHHLNLRTKVFQVKIYLPSVLNIKLRSEGWKKTQV